MKNFFFFLFLCLLSFPAFAVEPDEILKDPVLESRARNISRQLRCMVCQGEDIDASAAPLAADLRRLVRGRLVAGDSDAQALAFIHARYGDYVLMRPPFKAATLVLWLTPVLALGFGIFFLLRALRRKEAG